MKFVRLKATIKTVASYSYNVSSVVLMCSVYAKHWPHSDIRSCCCQSVHALTFRYDSTLATWSRFFTPKVFLHEILSLL